MSLIVLIASALTQLAAAIVAFSHIRAARWKLAWGLIAAALWLMALRRAVTIYGMMAGFEPAPTDLFAELIGLTVSIMLLVGVILMGRVFAKMQQERLFFRSIVENIPNMVFVKDAKDLRFVMVNKAGEDLVGLPREQLLGRNDFDFFPTEQADHFVEKDREALTKALVTDIPEEKIDTKSQGQRLLHTKKISIRDDQGVPLYLLGISEDVTEKRATENKLEEALSQAEAASQAKSEFLGLMSHELRTPLNAIIGFSQMLQAEVFGKHSTPQYKEYAGDIQSSGEHLLSVINDVLDLVKVEAGEMEPKMAPFSLHQALDECLKMFRAGQSHLQDRFQTDFGAETEWVLADNRMLKQTLLNILSNADKYTGAEGHVRVTAARRPDQCIEVSIADQGVGIPEDELERVQEPFIQARRREGITHEGTGLGLPISKKLMALQDGQLTLESTVGVGTTVRLIFKAA
ncbi:MAG: sensor histidine kinase [Rhodospirillaceae bacterium]